MHLGGRTFPVRHCTFEVRQATHQRGRISTKVRHGPVQLVLTRPENEVLLAWATDIVFLNAAGGSALETPHLPAAYYVSYAEELGNGFFRFPTPVPIAD